MWHPRDLPLQSSADLVDVAAWRRDENFGIFPGGTKPKQMVTAPQDSGLPFLIPGHPYLFKIAHGWRWAQMWSEYIAFRIARCVKLPVPACMIAIDSNTGDAGALVEFFYGYPGEARPARLVHAADLISGLHRGLAGGRPHNLRENIRIGKMLSHDDSSVEWWAKTLALDAIIGNSDRHTENWGYLVRRQNSGDSDYEFAPIFDNATSLGYEGKDDALSQFASADALTAYVRRGRSHVGIDMTSDRPTNHFDLIKAILKMHPRTKTSLQSVTQFTMLEVATILQECTQFAVAARMSSRRSDFVYALVKARKQLVEELIGFS